MIDQLGGPDTLQPLPDRLGGGVLDAVPDVQALLVPGRRLRPARDPLAEGDQGQGEVRHQYHHVTDIVPTILECCGIEFPDFVNGYEQTPLPGVSMRYSFDDADAPTTKRIQYYEMMGTRGLWNDGWKAVAARRRRSARGNFETTPGSSSTPTTIAPRPTTSPASTPTRSAS